MTLYRSSLNQPNLIWHTNSADYLYNQFDLLTWLFFLLISTFELISWSYSSHFLSFLQNLLLFFLVPFKIHKSIVQCTSDVRKMLVKAFYQWWYQYTVHQTLSCTSTVALFYTLPIPSARIAFVSLLTVEFRKIKHQCPMITDQRVFLWSSRFEAWTA